MPITLGAYESSPLLLNVLLWNSLICGTCRYRKFNLDGTEIIVRTELDTFMESSNNGESPFAFIRHNSLVGAIVSAPLDP